MSSKVIFLGGLVGALAACGSGKSQIAITTDDGSVMDHCASNPCRNGGACSNDGDAFVCACPAGFSGATCNANVDECASNPCLNGGVCTDGVNAFVCACPAQFTGTTCAINTVVGSGTDGDAVVTAGLINLSTTSVMPGRSCADGGDAVSYSVIALTDTAATLATSPSSGCLAVDDEVVLINLQGTAGANSNVGNYESLRVASVRGPTVSFGGGFKSKRYGSGATDDVGLGTTAADQRVVLLRVPNFASLTVGAGATLTVDAWDGVKGGVLFLHSAGPVTIDGRLSVDGKGYRGGPRPAEAAQSGQQGESYGGLGTAVQEALLGGGGGGLGEVCASFGSAGGGASYGTFGIGGTTTCTGSGGASYGEPTLAKLFFGSGGGSGGSDNELIENPPGGRGGAGGGILILKAASIAVTGGVSSRGTSGQGDAMAGCFGESTIDCWDYSGPGGGGAGGALLLSAGQVDLGTALVTAEGGGPGPGGTSSGGAGGAGRIAVRYVTSIAGSTTPEANMTALP